MDHVPKTEGRVPGEHHTRLPEIIAEVSVDAGVVLQLVGLNELEGIRKEEEMLVCLKEEPKPKGVCTAELNTSTETEARG